MDIAVAPIKVDAKVAASRDDIQQLALKLSPGEAAQKSAKTAVSEATEGGAITGPGGNIRISAFPFRACSSTTPQQRRPRNSGAHRLKAVSHETASRLSLKKDTPEAFSRKSAWTALRPAARGISDVAVMPGRGLESRK